MEFLVNQKTLPFIALAVLVLSCSKEQDPVFSSDPVDKRFMESMSWNIEHPYSEIKVNSDDYTILTIADIHTGTTINLDKFLTIARIEKPAAVIIDGDLTGGQPEKDYGVFENQILKNELPGAFYIAGNHDLWHNGWEEFYSLFGSSSYYFSVKTTSGSYFYICLDTAGGTLGKLQTKWVTGILESLRPQYRRCVVITHVNLFRPRKTESTNLVEEELCFLLDLFAKNKVDMIITGHDHKKDAEVLGMSTYIQLDALEDGLTYASYMNLHVKNGKIGYNFVNINDQK
jgi:predicted phosphodiesterase